MERIADSVLSTTDKFVAGFEHLQYLIKYLIKKKAQWEHNPVESKWFPAATAERCSSWLQAGQSVSLP